MIKKNESFFLPKRKAQEKEEKKYDKLLFTYLPIK